MAVTVAVGLAAALAAQPYLSGILLLWSAGLSLMLPLPVYAAALAAFVLGALTEFSRPARAHRGVGMILLLVAGVVPESSAHALVAVIAVILLSEPLPPVRSAQTL